MVDAMKHGMVGQPGKDGTPEWAYDEDGYCVCCFNGKWKYHAPWCGLRNALDVCNFMCLFAHLAGWWRSVRFTD